MQYILCIPGRPISFACSCRTFSECTYVSSLGFPTKAVYLSSYPVILWYKLSIQWRNAPCANLKSKSNDLDFMELCICHKPIFFAFRAVQHFQLYIQKVYKVIIAVQWSFLFQHTFTLAYRPQTSTSDPCCRRVSVCEGTEWIQELRKVFHWWWEHLWWVVDMSPTGLVHRIIPQLQIYN